MSGAARRLARFIGQMLPKLYPRREGDWAQAMRGEIEQIEEERAALGFALGCMWGGLRRLTSERFSRPEGFLMNNLLSAPSRARELGIACALASTLLGLAYLATAGAPPRYIVVNAAAFLLGIVALRGIRGANVQPGRFASGAMIVLAPCLLATALFGTPVDGMTRWIWVGPLGVQLSLVFLPMMIVLFARQPDAVGTIAIATAALALALQPDRAMAGVLVLSMAVLAAMRPDRWTTTALLVALASCAAAFARPDSLPAVPYVDQILFSAFGVHILAGAAVMLGSIILLVPAAAAWRCEPGLGHVHMAFGATWLGCVLAAALGNYPTPVVGYGGSAILGYLLSLSVLPPVAAAERGPGLSPGGNRAGEHTRELRTAAA